MTALADEPPASFTGVVQPVIARQGPGIHACEKNSFGARPDFLPKSMRQRSESSIEPYDQQARRLERILDEAQLIPVQGKWLLDEYGLAGTERSRRERRVT